MNDDNNNIIDNDNDTDTETIKKKYIFNEWVKEWIYKWTIEWKR